MGRTNNQVQPDAPQALNDVSELLVGLYMQALLAPAVREYGFGGFNLDTSRHWRGVFARLPASCEQVDIRECKLNGKLLSQCKGSRLQIMFSQLPANVQRIYLVPNQQPMTREELQDFINAKLALEQASQANIKFFDGSPQNPDRDDPPAPAAASCV